MLAGQNGARGRSRTCTGDALDVVSLLLDYASEMDGASCRCRPGLTFIQRKPAGCRKEAKWSQSPVLPWAQRAYGTCLSAGSTATLPDEEEWGPHPELHRVPLPTEQAHRSKCFGGAEIGRRETTCTSKAACGSKPGGSAIPREPRAEKLASLTGFAPVISCMRGRHVG